MQFPISVLGGSYELPLSIGSHRKSFELPQTNRNIALFYYRCIWTTFQFRKIHWMHFWNWGFDLPLRVYSKKISLTKNQEKSLELSRFYRYSTMIVWAIFKKTTIWDYWWILATLTFQKTDWMHLLYCKEFNY